MPHSRYCGGGEQPEPLFKILKTIKKMYKNILQSIAGIEIYPLISFAIFFGFFLCLILYVILADKNMMKNMSELPLQTDDVLNQTEGVNRL
jgi:hypothetical protein